MEEQDIYLLITRYLSLKTSSEENEFLADWINASADNEATFTHIKTIWSLSKISSSPASADDALDKTKLKLGLIPKTKKRIDRSFYAVISLAAVFFVVFCTGLFFLFKSKNTKGLQISFFEKRTGQGEKIKFKLDDGTTVYMAPESYMKYPKKFNIHYRDVYLEGEAYFEVTKNRHCPFTVNTGIWKTRVLGTRFNVSAFRQQNYLSVSLIEGKVKVLNNQHNYNLVAGQELLLDKRNNNIYLRNFEEDAITGWMTNKLVFRNETLSKAAEQIDLLYGVKIVFANEQTANCKIWATFSNVPLHSILEALKLSSNIRYETDGKIIHLTIK